MGDSVENSFKFGKNKKYLQNHSHSKTGANTGVVTNIKLAKGFNDRRTAS